MTTVPGKEREVYQRHLEKQAIERAFQSRISELFEDLYADLVHPTEGETAKATHRFLFGLENARAALDIAMDAIEEPVPA